jgi:Predicted membrane protein
VSTAPVRHASAPESVVLLVLRVVLGSLFIAAAVLKLWWGDGDPPQAFAEAIKAYKVIPTETGEPLIALLAYAIPWAELLAGVLLVVGLWARPAAMLLVLQLLAFTGAIGWVILKGFDVKCSCFGNLDWPCPGTIGTCHLIRNGTLLAVALLLAWRGSGRFALWPDRRPARQPMD